MRSAYGHHIERAWIGEYIIIYCLGGQGWFECQGQHRTITKGEVLIVFPGVPHAYGANKQDPWTIQWAHFNGRLAPDLLALANIFLDQPVVSIGERLSIITLFSDILQQLQAGFSLHYLIYAAACLRQILSEIALLTAYSPPTDTKDLNAKKIISFMRNNLTESCTLDDFAGEACISRSHFARKFREKTGYSPIDYFIRLKIQKACELLETTDLKVGEISRSLGYRDQFYFSRIFKKIMETSPKAYRLISREV
jgi:AraC-like DNA-binding protein